VETVARAIGLQIQVLTPVSEMMINVGPDKGSAAHVAAPLFVLERMYTVNEFRRPVTAKFDPKLLDELRESARRNRLSVSDVVRQSVLDRLRLEKAAVRTPA
jgi:hypothetical protein